MSNISAKFQYDWIKDGEMTAISKQALFSTFYTQQRKDDIIMTSLLIWSAFSLLQIFILSQSNSVQNLSSLTLKTKELWRGVENNPPRSYTSQKSPVLIGLRRRMICSEAFWQLDECNCPGEVVPCKMNWFDLSLNVWSSYKRSSVRNSSDHL